MRTSHPCNTHPAPTTPLITNTYATGQAYVQFLYCHGDDDDRFPRTATAAAAAAAPSTAMYRFLQQLRRYCQALDYYVSRWFRLVATRTFDHARYMQQVLLPRLAVLVERWGVATAGLGPREVVGLVQVERWLGVVRADVEWLRREGLVKGRGERGDVLQLGVCLQCGRHWVGVGA